MEAETNNPTPTQRHERIITRAINWRNVVAFHADIARRMEESFFEVPLGSSRSDRWSPLPRFVPPDASGAWEFRTDIVDQESVQAWCNAPGGAELFVGGPCWIGFRREQGGLKKFWRPMLYRSVRLERMDEGGYRIIPERGTWDVSPILSGILENKEQVAIERPLSEMVVDWLEKGFRPAEGERRNATQRLRDAILGDLPMLAQHVNRAVTPDAGHPFTQQPTPWILFSAPQSSGMTRHLVGDYKRLGELLAQPNADIGGLRLFEGYREPADSVPPQLSPIIPLNESQEAAVRDILASRPITVISGPPGCGKSQVVLSVLLNAWEHGTSVLFSSNNNQAVDVVRDRLSKFEDDFPVVVRSGSREHSTLLSTLMNTVNYVTGRTVEPPSRVADSRARLEALVQQANELKAFLASNLPDQVNQTLRSALGAYGKYQETFAEHARINTDIHESFKLLCIECLPENFLEEVLHPTEQWIARLPHYESLIASDLAARNQIELEIRQLSCERDKSLSEAGLSVELVAPEQLLVNEAAPEAFGEWLIRYQQLLVQPLDRQLEPFPWQETYDRWPDEESAIAWAAGVRDVVAMIRKECANAEDAYFLIEELRTRYEKQLGAIEKRGIDSGLALPDGVLEAWSAGFAAETTILPGRMDWLPWSDRSRARRAMRRAERVFRPAIALAVWQQIGQLDGPGRARLAEVVAQLRNWLSVRAEWDATADERERLEQMATALRRSVNESAQKADGPRSADPATWRQYADALEHEASFAEEASAALGRRQTANLARAAIRDELIGFRSSAAASSIRDAWLNGPAVEFSASLERLEREATPDSVRKARSALAATRVVRFIELWTNAREIHKRVDHLVHQLSGILPVKARCAGWRGEIPAKLAGLVELPTEKLPGSDHPVFVLISRIRNWHKRWDEFVVNGSPALQRREMKERQWANEKLVEAAKLLPDGDAKRAAQQLVNQALSASTQWPTVELQRAFEQFNPERIKASIQGLQSQIQSTAFSIARAAWLNRVVSDRTVQDALDDLHKHYSKYIEKLRPDGYDLFKRSLAALPLWVSTAMASQSIPMEAGVFDILVIDEATQCTITNVLPLIFRAKRLVVIGDANQLPAIPAVGQAAESALSARHGLSEEILQLLGHNTNDLYRAAVRCMPGGRNRVRLLNEHYRSHPLIIGFSNQYVYQKKLRLRTKPVSKDHLPFGNAIHGRNIAGACAKGEFNISWINEMEADEVKRLLQEISNVPTLRSLSVGVVTPFRAQEKLITEMIRNMEMAANVQIGTAHAFQGDERDIMIFSPVVSNGMTPGAAKWVEEPKNLINVAITRARQSLFVVADFAQCRAQPGILGNLIKYVETVELLRKTSLEELDLFSWMTVQGWNPQIQAHKKLSGIEVDFIMTNNGRTLAIEVDGRQHESSTAADSARDAMLVGKGYEVLRVPAREIREMPARVIQTIAERLGLPLD